MISSNVNPADKEMGVKGYYAHVVSCKACGKKTNLLFASNGKRILACSQECADKLTYGG